MSTPLAYNYAILKTVKNGIWLAKSFKNKNGILNNLERKRSKKRTINADHPWVIPFDTSHPVLWYLFITY